MSKINGSPIRLASSLAGYPALRVLLEGLFEHPAGYSDPFRDLQAVKTYRVST
jgi:hypothetical protein